MVRSKFLEDDTQTITGNGRQDDGSQEDTCAVAPGKVGKHVRMITCLLRLGKEKEVEGGFGS
jgi:hypothetical protein